VSQPHLDCRITLGLVVSELYIILLTHLLTCLLLVTVWKTTMYFRYLKRDERCIPEKKLNVSVSLAIIFVGRLVTGAYLSISGSMSCHVDKFLSRNWFKNSSVEVSSQSTQSV